MIYSEMLLTLIFQKILCTYAFPQCQGGVGLPLCYEDCQAVRHQFCFNEWALIEDNKVREIYIRSRSHFRLPDCDRLPKYTKEKCSHISLTAMNQDLITCKPMNLPLQNLLYPIVKYIQASLWDTYFGSIIPYK